MRHSAGRGNHGPTNDSGLSPSLSPSAPQIMHVTIMRVSTVSVGVMQFLRAHSVPLVKHVTDANVRRRIVCAGWWMRPRVLNFPRLTFGSPRVVGSGGAAEHMDHAMEARAQAQSACSSQAACEVLESRRSADRT
jgi:hypothetical protein